MQGSFCARDTASASCSSSHQLSCSSMSIQPDLRQGHQRSECMVIPSIRSSFAILHPAAPVSLCIKQPWPCQSMHIHRRIAGTQQAGCLGLLYCQCPSDCGSRRGDRPAGGVLCARGTCSAQNLSAARLGALPGLCQNTHPTLTDACRGLNQR